MKLLVEKGADIDAKNIAGITALLSAVLNGNADLVRFLVARGADANVSDNYGHTVIRFAETKENSEVVKILLEAGAKASQKRSRGEKLRFDYDYKVSDYARKMKGIVEDPEGLWNALVLLQAPLGAHGAYGTIGDDYLLGQEPGYGLRQLSRVAGRYLTIETLHVEQPAGYSEIGVHEGVFTSADELNDVLLEWVFYDLRPNFEADLIKLLKLIQ